MTTRVEVFIADDRERRRKQRTAAMAIVVAGAVVLLTRKPEEPEPVAITLPSRPPSTLRHDLLTPSTAPPTPVIIDVPPAAAPAVVAPPPHHEVIAKRPVPVPAPAPVPSAPQPQAPPSVATTTTPVLPPLALLVHPRAIHFNKPGWQPVTITNPNAESVRIVRVSIRGSRTSGYQLDAKKCLGISLRTHENCRVTVLATPSAVLGQQMITIDVEGDRVE